ncbi:MAG: amidase [Burkholderiaceae bacterium]|nr:MAG: amidase [Burkholderiaceae bacterium]
MGAAAVDDLTALSAEALSRTIHAREVSCREVMAAYLARIERLNPHYNAIVSLRDADALLREADARDAQLARGESLGWMHGMPQAIRDLANATGLPTTLGSPLMRHFVPTQDGLMVARMKAAGCIVIGKTNVPEFGLGSHTFNPVFGTTRNAWDASRAAGGSSGGAAVALALRLLPVADGSDFMGSLRNPAAWNHVFGLRPAQGRVPMWPAPEVWVSQLGTEGPMARTVADLARLLQTQAGFDPRAPLSIATTDQLALGCGENSSKSAPQPRIGWLGDLGGYLATEPGVLAVCEAALSRLQAAGCAVEPTAPGFSPASVWDAWLVWRQLLVASRIAPFMHSAASRAQVKPEAQWEYDSAQGLSGAAFLRASVERSAFYQHLLALFDRFDALALPAAQVWPFDAEQRWPTHIGAVQMDTYHRWMEVTIYASFAGLPALSMPAGFDTRGLPMGLQLIGRPQGEAALLALAARYEAASADLLARRPLAAH